MTEAEFWYALRMRINSAPECELPGYCDWFEPKKYVLNGSEPRVVGRVGFVDGRRSDRSEFTLHLVRAVDSLDAIDWNAHLPADDARGWLTYDEQRLTIEPPHAPS